MTSLAVPGGQQPDPTYDPALPVLQAPPGVGPAPIQGPTPPQSPARQPSRPFGPDWNEYDELAAQDDERSRSIAEETFRLATKTDPAAAREAAFYAEEIGLDPGVSERNSKEARAIIDRRDFRLSQSANPITSGMAGSPWFTKQITDDFKNLSNYESAAYGAETGRLQVEKGRIGSKMLAGIEDPADITRMAEIDLRLSVIPRTRGIIGNAAEMFGQMGETVPLSIAAGLAATVPVLIAGQAGPQALLAEEAVTAPVAFGFGFMTASALQSAQIEGGLAYVDLIDKGVSRRTARFASVGVGIVNSALETVGIGFATKPIRDVLKRKVGRELAADFVRPTFGAAAKNLAKGYIISIAAETTTEVLQEVSNIVAEGSTTGNWDGAGARIGEVAAKTAQGMLLLGAPGSGFRAYFDVQAARNAKAAQTHFDARVRAASQSKLRAGNPTEFERHAARVEEATGPDVAYIDATALSELFKQRDAGREEGARLSLDEIDELIPGMAQRVRTAIEQGSDVAIPASEFSTKLAGTPIGNALQQHVRFDEDGPSPAEADAVLADAEKLADEAVEATAEEITATEQARKELDKISADLAAQAVAAGIGKREASRFAAGWRAHIEVWAEKTGQTPAEYQTQFPLSVQFGEVAGDALRQFAGVKAKGAPRSSVRKAASMLSEGSSSDEIHAQTGWSISPTGNLRFEISDDEASLTGSPGRTLSEILHHPRLFKAYPQLSTLVVTEFTDADVLSQPKEVAGFYDTFPATSSARIDFQRGKSAGGQVRLRPGMSDKNKLSLLLHEVQHAIQDIEGVDLVAFSGKPYKSSAVEVEARNTQARQSMTAKERAATPPLRTEDIPRADQKIYVDLRKGDEGVTRGGFNPLTFRITLTKDANSSTLLHELGHAFLEIQAHLAAQTVELEAAGTAPAHPTIAKDFQDFLDWAGVKDAATWQGMTLEQQRKHHENFAANFEDYLFRGEAPTPKLRSLFQRFMAWLRKAYVGIRDRLNAQHRKDFGEDLLPLTPEIRAVFDRLLASEDEVAATYAIRQGVAAFQTWQEAEASGVTPEQWATLQDKQQAAVDEATSELGRRSVSAMKWARGAVGRLLKALQREAKSQRDAMKSTAAAAVQYQPVYRAMRWLKQGELVNEDGTHTQADKGENHKLRTEDVKAFGVELPGMTRADGINPDTVAKMFRFDSGEAMIRQLAAAPPIAEAIEAEITRRLVAQHSKVATAAQRQEIVEKALHGDARLRFVLAEFRAIDKGAKGKDARITLATIKEAARIALENKAVREVSPKLFSAAAKRAASQSAAAVKAGDTAEAITWKRRQMLQEQMASQSIDLAKQLDRQVKSFKRYNDTDANIGKTRDVDAVHVAQALAAAYGLGPTIDGAQRRDIAARSLAAIQETEPVLFDRATALLRAAQLNRGGTFDYRKIPVRHFQEVAEVADLAWFIAKERRQLSAEGRAADTKEAVDSLVQAVAARPARVAPGSREPTTSTASPGKAIVMKGWGVVATLKRLEHWSFSMDGGKAGPFTRYFVDPIRRLSATYRAEKKAVVAEYARLVTEVQQAAGAKWGAEIHAPALVSAKFKVFRNKADLLGALLHTGTHSNFQKLLRGNEWGAFLEDGETLDSSRWDKAVDDLIERGILTKADFDFVQAVWGLYAKFLPIAQKTHKKLYGFEFKTIEHRQFTNDFGTYSGGYVPARVDRYRSKQRVDTETIAGQERGFQFSISTGKDFTLERTEEFAQPLDMDLGRQLSHIDAELRFIYLQPAIKDAMRLVRNERFAKSLNAYDREAINEIIVPSLENVALQSATRPGNPFLDAIIGAYRQATSLVALGGSLINAAIQSSGIAQAAGHVPSRYLFSALGRWVANPWAFAKEARTLSLVMAQRSDRTTTNLRAQVVRLANPGIVSAIKASRDYGSRGAFFLQGVTQGILDVVTWQGAFEQANADGLTGQEAIDFADRAVILTQGSANPESVAAYEAGTPFVRLFGQFTSFSNLSLNQIMGAQPGLPRAKAIGLTLFMVALIEGTLRTLLQGGPRDEDDDGEITIADLAATYGKTIARNVAGYIPLGGSMMLALAESEGSRVTSPVDTSKTLVRGLAAFIELFTDDKTSEADARNLAAFLSVVTGWPIAAPVRQAIPTEPR